MKELRTFHLTRPAFIKKLIRNGLIKTCSEISIQVITLKVYILTGMPGAGKEEFVRVAQEVGFNVVRMGDVVRAEAKKRGMPGDDKSIGGFAHAEREAHGYDIWARRTLPFITEFPTIIDGCRGEAEVEVFRSSFAETMIIAIHSSPHTRYQRLRERGRDDAPRNWNEFVERDFRELGWGLGNVIALADIMIVNEDTLSHFQEEVKRILDRLR